VAHILQPEVPAPRRCRHRSQAAVIVGESMGAESSRAFIWTSQDGLEPLGHLPESYTSSGATGVSADGSVVVGYAASRSDSGSELRQAFVWTAQRGFIFLGDFVPSFVPGTTSSAFGVSANGEVVVGEARYDVNDMGEPIPMAFRWTRDSGLFPLGWLYDAQPSSAAFTASADGSVVGGERTSTGAIPVPEPMRWTPVTSMVTLGRGLIGAVLATSADGTSMAGGAADPGTAFVWDTQNGYRNLLGLLEESGLDGGLQGHAPIAAYGTSTDGTIVVGTGLGDGVARGFFVRLP
jgi:probable HAF family extracellular repeat protein